MLNSHFTDNHFVIFFHTKASNLLLRSFLLLNVYSALSLSYDILTTVGLLRAVHLSLVFQNVVKALQVSMVNAKEDAKQKLDDLQKAVALEDCRQLPDDLKEVGTIVCNCKSAGTIMWSNSCRHQCCC